MGARQSLPEGAAEELAAMLQEARTTTEFQAMQCVWLRAG
jgi:hypothetical protein